MTYRRPIRAALVGGCLLLASGCGAAAQTPPVPEIDGAKDARGLDPCTLLPAEQAVRLGLAPQGLPVGAAEGPGCEWRGEDDTSLAVVLYVDGGGLATLAENSEPTTSRVRVGGYPALETFTEQGAFCQYDIGVAPEQAVLVRMEGGAPDSCTALQDVIGDILATMPSTA